MSGKYYDVDVRKVDIGHIIVKAESPEEAMQQIKHGNFRAIKSEFWTSITLTPLMAKIADVVPKRLQDLEQIEEEI